METIDLIYDEVKHLKKEVCILRRELVNFKIKVIIYAATVSAVVGGGVAELLPLLS